ncbi:MAG: glycoside hydrolase family 36 protein [Candidatus Sericytochromatia bacterium]|nr:glycoside hydrolase family 36 protein [Candidatus Sericytochromatia bacterium]
MLPRTLEGGGLVARLLPEGLEVVTPQGRPLLTGITARIGLADGTTWALPAGPWQAQAPGAQRTGLNPGGIRRRGGDMRLTWTVTPHPQGLQLGLCATNCSEAPLAVSWLEVLAAPWPDGWRPEALRVSQAGWQSWSPATPGLPLVRQRPLPEPPIAGLAGAPTAGFTSPWVCEIDPGEAPGLTLGFLQAVRWPGLIHLAPGWRGGRLVATCLTAGEVLAPGAELTAEPLLLLPEGPEALGRYAEAVAAHVGLSQPPRPAPRGWCSWYTHFGAVTEADVLRNAHALAAQRPMLPVEVIQVDDGWQHGLGDWLRPSQAFPHGLATLAAALRQLGFRAGLWLAPFVVGAHSEVAHAHPDWLVRGAAGEPLLALDHWGQRCHALDLARPEVRAHLSHVVRTLVAGWGFDFLKLDFLYAGALPGPRAGGASPLEAYRLGLAALRNAAGNGYLLGCGAPLLPSVGLVDAMRVGPDVAATWWPPDGDASAPALANALRSSLARGWMHGRWWWNDPDCLLLGAEHRGLTAAEQGAWAAAVLLSGGARFLSDEVPALSADAWEVAARVFAHPAGAAGRVLACNDDALPTRVWQPVPAWGAAAGLAAIFNPTDHPQGISASPHAWPGPPHPWVLVPGRRPPRWRPWRGALRLALPPHGVALLLVAPAPRPPAAGGRWPGEAFPLPQG